MLVPAIVGVVFILVAGPVAAQSAGSGQSGKRPLLPREREIALARSAGPASVTDAATIYVLGERGYVEAVKGSNGAACYVSRDWIESIEPHCFDPEGASTILPLAMHRVTLLHQGKTLAEANRDVADGLASGRFRLPRRPAMSYMLSAAQSLTSDDGTKVGAWQPHLMIYYPYWTAKDVGLSEETPTISMSDPGKPTASLVIVVRDFVQPGSGQAGAR